ncbi:hypothetical protein CDN93_00535 [Escherichia coli]|nr:hypothetical protein CDN93_00535 [Escherichia coli]PAS66526.1 hypothetical protein CDN91_04280 [Escherichia coli]PAS79573.1 hypothetical protein CDN94_00540 [Escherichia coli]
MLRVVTSPHNLNPPSAGFVISRPWYSLGLVYLVLIHWLDFFYVSASDLRYMMFPQFAPPVLRGER